MHTIGTSGFDLEAWFWRSFKSLTPNEARDVLVKINWGCAGNSHFSPQPLLLKKVAQKSIFWKMESLVKSWENTKSQMSYILLSIYKKHSISIQG